MITPERCDEMAAQERQNSHYGNGKHHIERAEAFELLSKMLRQEPIAIINIDNNYGDYLHWMKDRPEQFHGNANGLPLYALPVAVPEEWQPIGTAPKDKVIEVWDEESDCVATASWECPASDHPELGNWSYFRDDLGGSAILCKWWRQASIAPKVTP